MISEVLFVMVFCFSVKINRRVGDLSYQRRKWIVRGVEKAAEESAKKRSSEIDPCILQSTEPLGEDHAQEQFFEAIPGFFSSDVVKDPQADLPLVFRFKFRQTLDEFLDHTLSSSSVSESLKVSRFFICLNAAQVTCGPPAVSRILVDIFDGRWRDVLRSVEIGHRLRHWSSTHRGLIALYVQSIVSCIVAKRTET
jgi:hypothetical protein